MEDDRSIRPPAARTAPSSTRPRRTTGWQNFNVAYPEGSYHHYGFGGGRVAVSPDRIMVRADRRVRLMTPRTWKADGECFVQFFYHVPGEGEAGSPAADEAEIVLSVGERWRTSLQQ